MSKTYPARTYPPQKNVFMSQTIPDTFIDQIRTIVNAGEYGKLEELLINFPVNLNFNENKLNTSLLHGVIRSTITNTQKLRLVELLIKHGIPINVLDDNGLPPLFYAIQLQLYEISKILIDKSNNLNNLPKNYDYFRLALSPNIVNCEPQLISQNESYMGKYYSQQLDIERKFRDVIFQQDITKDIVKYILEFAKTIPEKALTFIDIDLREIKNTFSVRLEGQEYKEIFPPFENKVKLYLDTVTDKIKADLLQGKYNEDQLITAKIDMIKSVHSELRTMLNARSVSDSINVKQYEYNSNNNPATPDEIYNNFINPTDYNINTLFDNLIDKYFNEDNGIVKSIIENVKEFRSAIETNTRELRELDRNIFKLRGANRQINADFINDKIQNFRDFLGGNINIYYDQIRPIFNSINEITRINNQNNNTKISIINKFKKLIYLSNSVIYYISGFIEEYILVQATDNQEIKDKINELRNIVNRFDQIPILNIKLFNEFIITLNNISEIWLLYHKFNPTLEKKLLFNDSLFLYKKKYCTSPEFFSYYNQNQNIKLFGVPDQEFIRSVYFPNNMNIVEQDIPYTPYTPQDWDKILNTLIYDPNDFKITNMNYILVIFYEKIFKYFMTNPKNDYNLIRDEFKLKNPTISDTIIDTVLLKILHSAIIHNFEEMLNLTLLTASNTIINKKLDTDGLDDKFADINEDKIIGVLKKKEQKQLLKRDNIDQVFYLDENYMSSEPIDIIPCVNNNVEILKLLKKKMNINLKEYYELIFKLGDKNILRELNATTRNKLNIIELTSYREKNKNKFKEALKFFNNQLSDEIKQKELNFLINNEQNVKEEDINLEEPIELTMNREEPILRLNPFPPRIAVAVAPDWIYNLRFKDIYDDLIQNQAKSNIFLYEKIRYKLDYIFRDIIIPQIKNFLQFHADQNLDTIVTYDNLKDNLKPLISDIINYHLNIDPSKAKIEVIPLENTLSKFRDLFINLLDERDKQSIPNIYDDRLKNKIFDFMTLISKYYHNVYRNYLKFVFNDYRYSVLFERDN